MNHAPPHTSGGLRRSGRRGIGGCSAGATAFPLVQVTIKLLHSWLLGLLFLISFRVVALCRTGRKSDTVNEAPYEVRRRWMVDSAYRWPSAKRHTLDTS